jgi:hypothetical protein
MALVKFLKIDGGRPREHDEGNDSVNLSDVQFGGVSLAGTTGPTALGDDSTQYSNISPAGDTLNQTLLAIDSALGSVVSNESNVTETYTNDEGAAITVGQAVYIDSADKVKLADASDSAKDNPMGFVKPASIADQASGGIVTGGLAEGFTGLVAGDIYYLGAAGAITNSVPSSGRVFKVGVAKSATELQIQFQDIGLRDD